MPYCGTKVAVGIPLVFCLDSISRYITGLIFIESLRHYPAGAMSRTRYEWCVVQSRSILLLHIIIFYSVLIGLPSFAITPNLLQFELAFCLALS